MSNDPGAPVIVGVSRRTRRRLRRIGLELATDDEADVQPAAVWGDDTTPSSRYEQQCGIDQPIVVYPLFESALRSNNGKSLAAHRDRLARLWTDFNRVVRTPYADGARTRGSVTDPDALQAIWKPRPWDAQCIGTRWYGHNDRRGLT